MMFGPAAAGGRIQRSPPLGKKKKKKNVCSVVITLVVHVREGKERENRLLVEGERERERESGGLPWRGGQFENRRRRRRERV